jgi:His/Glu/Gln/Arg/opine family amino acid ABC transporter permease subunit
MPRWLAHTIVVVLFAALIALAFSRVNYAWNWAGVWEYRQKLVQGFGVTVGISVAALVASTLIGMLAAVLLEAKNPLLEAVGRVYVELIRGTPLLVQLLIGFYVVASAVGLENRYVVGVLVLALFSGAYMTEIFRGGLAAIPQTQRDSARAIGLTPWQSFRLVILPQADSPRAARRRRSVRLAHQGFFPALRDRGLRIHPRCPGSEFLHLLHAGKLPAAGRRLPAADAAAVGCVAAARAPLSV